MNNLTIYCLCLHDELLEKVKKINYLPVALGENNFQNGWIRDNQKINISKKNKFYVSFSSASSKLIILKHRRFDIGLQFIISMPACAAL